MTVLNAKQRMDAALNQMDDSVDALDVLGAAYKVTLSASVHYGVKGVESYTSAVVNDVQVSQLLAPIKARVKWEKDRKELLEDVTELVKEAYEPDQQEAAIAALMADWEKGRPRPELPTVAATATEDSTES